MQNKQTFFQKGKLFFKGLIMGVANKVPGVSGGTVSYVLGFYEELIYSFKKINAKAFQLLFSAKFNDFYKHINGQFLLLVMGGSIFSYFSVSLILDFFLKNYELYVWSWFFGMIIGSIFYIGKDFKKWNYKNYIAFVFGITVGIAISFLTPAKENDNLWFIFFCGIISIVGITLPGLSGSFILMLLGNYVLLLVDSVNVLLEVFSGLLKGNFSILENTKKTKYLKILTVFTTGSIFGLVSISHILSYILQRYKKTVNALIIGFITGSLGIVWPWKETLYLQNSNGFLLDKEGNKIVENYQRFIPSLTEFETWIAILFITFGLTLILVIDFYGRNKK